MPNLLIDIISDPDALECAENFDSWVLSLVLGSFEVF